MSAIGPVDKLRALSYYEARSPAYSERASAGLLAWLRRREELAITRALGLDQGAGRTLLDVGCGDGKYSLLAQRAGLLVSAVDASPGMISRLRGRVLEASVEDWEARDPRGTYDRVLCAGMLDFVLDPREAFRKLCRSVGPGGRLVVLVPRRGWGGLFYRFEKRLCGFRVNLFAAGELEAWAREEGLGMSEVLYPLPNNLIGVFRRPGAQTRTARLPQPSLESRGRGC